MSVAVDIKNQIKKKIQSCPSVQEVYGYEEIAPEGWPAVMITRGAMNGEFASNTENSRIYSYRALILFPLGSTVQTPANLNRLEYADNVVATVIDEIINAVDTAYVLDGTPVLYVNAADVQPGIYPIESGEAMGAEITLNVYTEYKVQ